MVVRYGAEVVAAETLVERDNFGQGAPAHREADPISIYNVGEVVHAFQDNCPQTRGRSGEKQNTKTLVYRKHNETGAATKRVQATER